MSSRWPMVPLGDVLTRSEEWLAIQPELRYKEVTVRLWGKGVVQRREVTGAEIASANRLVVHAGQFILSRIDARNGAAGLVPPELDGAVVSNDFPVFTPNAARLEPAFLGWFSKTQRFIELCKAASEGTTNRVRLKEERFLATEIPLPTLPEQRRLVGRIEAVAARTTEANALHLAVAHSIRQLLMAAFHRITADAPTACFGEVAPLVRRPVEAESQGLYHELGIRSFNKGTFHKPPVEGASLGSKRIYRIEASDLVFNNVFAWEGAVAVARPEDDGRVGSHRFITCVPRQGVASSAFLCFYFSTRHGLEQLGEASPGGAGRNRTLGLEALARIRVPLPAHELQVWFDGLQAKAASALNLQRQAAAELEALLPAILGRSFKGEL